MRASKGIREEFGERDFKIIGIRRKVSACLACVDYAPHLHLNTTPNAMADVQKKKQRMMRRMIEWRDRRSGQTPRSKPQVDPTRINE